jgi:hypothetical protein
MKAQRWSKGLSLTSVLDGVGGQSHDLVTLPPLGKTLFPCYRRLGGLQGQSGWVQKIWPPTGIRSLDCPVCSELAVQLVREILHMSISYGCWIRGIEVYDVWSLFSSYHRHFWTWENFTHLLMYQDFQSTSFR